MTPIITLLITSLLVSLGINMTLFAIAYLKQTDKFTDFSYALSFASVAMYGYWVSERSILDAAVLAMVLAWSLRLGGYLAYRIHVIGRDTRFDEFRHEFWGFFKFWFFQGLAAWVILMPAMFIFSSQSPGRIGLLSMLGIAIWAVGLTIETVADMQKFNHKQEKRSPAWVDSGLWHYSRHPNYFGEMVCWWGIFVMTLPIMTSQWHVGVIISPLTIMAILIFASGIPPLERRYQKKYGNDPEYQKYLRETSRVMLWTKYNKA
ncbi:MAG: DUF1295 domain-containing protein [Microgenomates group bacterium]